MGYRSASSGIPWFRVASCSSSIDTADGVVSVIGQRPYPAIDHRVSRAAGDSAYSGAMAYLKPGLAQPLVNKLAMRLGLGGVAQLTVMGRRTGNQQTIPVVPVDVDDVTYLVSARGETEWVRNLRASGSCKLQTRGQPARRYTAEEVPTEARTPIIEAYRAKAGRTVSGFWQKLPDAADHPTFQLTPA
jgi:deazaflavin-dependent oxidoreductase (nitroreductase family)